MKTATFTVGDTEMDVVTEELDARAKRYLHTSNMIHTTVVEKAEHQRRASILMSVSQQIKESAS